MSPLSLQSPVFALAPMVDFTPLARYIASLDDPLPPPNPLPVGGGINSGPAAPFAPPPAHQIKSPGDVTPAFGPGPLFHLEYARVHENTAWDDGWLDFIRDYGPTRPVIAQLIGCEPDYFAKAVSYLTTLPISGIDLNLGCPVPKVFKKNVGGGLLRDLQSVDLILGRLRDAVSAPLTLSVKFRLGFDTPDAWAGVLQLMKKHAVDFGTVHLRTVADGYRAPATHALAAEIVKNAPCPLLLNGDIQTLAQAQEFVKTTGAWGVSIGRGAIRYPWIFKKAQNPSFAATYADAYRYLLWIVKNSRSIGPMKGYLNFLGLSVDENGKFLKAMRQSRTPEDLLKLGQQWLLSRGEDIFPEEPFPKLYARPSIEKPKATPA